MAGIKNRHIVFFRHFVYCVKKAQEILFSVYIFLSVCRKQNIFSFFKAEPFMNIRSLNFFKIIMQNLRHRRAGNICALLGQATIGKIAPCMLGISHINIRNDINYSSVCFLGQAFVLAAVSRLHMKNRNMKPLCADNGKAAVCISEHKNGIRLDLRHKLIALRNFVAAGFAEIITDGI